MSDDEYFEDAGGEDYEQQDDERNSSRPSSRSSSSSSSSDHSDHSDHSDQSYHSQRSFHSGSDALGHAGQAPRPPSDHGGGGMGGAAAALAGLALGGHGGGHGGGGGHRGAEQGFAPGYPNQGQAQGYGGAPGYSHDNAAPAHGGYGYGNTQQEQYGLPGAGPPSRGYEPTGAGYVPPQDAYVAPQPANGAQKTAAGGHAQQQQQGRPYFEYSTCTGQRKALLIGINYFGTQTELAGCINDVHNVQRFIQERFGYAPDDMVLLTDDSTDPRKLPTKANILRAMQWLVADAHRDDALFFHFSGHGTQVEDVDGDEGDDDDEAICPLDYEQAGMIVDDDSDHDILVKPLPAGCRLTAIFDSCHSGTVMDLPYVYSTEGTIKQPDLSDGAQDDLMSAGMAAIKGDSGGLFKGLMSVAKGAFDAKKAHAKGKKTNTSPADVIQWAGCKDSQTSADTEEAGRATGAMSYAFIAALTRYPQQSYQQLLVSIREEMKGKYTQKPQLSACHPIDTELMFVA